MKMFVNSGKLLDKYPEFLRDSSIYMKGSFKFGVLSSGKAFPQLLVLEGGVFIACFKPSCPGAFASEPSGGADVALPAKQAQQVHSIDGRRCGRAEADVAPMDVGYLPFRFLACGGIEQAHES